MIAKYLTSGMAGSRCLNNGTWNLSLPLMFTLFSHTLFPLSCKMPSVLKAFITILLHLSINLFLGSANKSLTLTYSDWPGLDEVSSQKLITVAKIWDIPFSRPGSQGMTHPCWTSKHKNGSSKESGMLLSEKESRGAEWARVTHSYYNACVF